MKITKRQLRRIIREEFTRADFPYRKGDEVEIMDPQRGTTYMARVVKLYKDVANVEEGGEIFPVKYADIVDNTGPGTKVTGGGVVREMKITKRQLRQIIKEELDRSSPMSEGYMVPSFANTASMENWIEELDPDDQVEQDVIDPETGELMIAAGETSRDQDWWEDVVGDVESPEEPVEFDWEAYEAEEDARIEQRMADDERIQNMVTDEAVAAGEDWASDTLYDAKNNPGMWKDQYSSAEEYVESSGQTAASDVADAILQHGMEREVDDWYKSLPDKESTWAIGPEANRPTKWVMKDIVADYFYDGVGRVLAKARG